jgi:hypothetical protein
MTDTDFDYKELHLLSPRSDGSVRFLSYIYAACSNGNIPRLTDEYLGDTLEKHPVTIGRWRALWESMGILKTKQRHTCTHYAIDYIALTIAISEAKARKQQAKANARAKAIARRVTLDAKTAEHLRQQCLTSFPQTQPIVNSQPNHSAQLQKTREERSFVLKDRESSFHENQGSHHPSLEPEPKTSLEAIRQSHLEAESNETSKTSPNNSHPENAIPAAQRAWFLDAAKRLIINSGKAWNKTLQTALEALNTTQLINLVSAFWEQTLKGNVQDAPKWLCKAAQKVANGHSYRPTRKFHLPKQLPQPPAAEILIPPKHSILPTWLPTWAIPNVEALLQRVGSFTWIDEINDGGGIRVNWANGHQDFLNPRGAFA